MYFGFPYENVDEFFWFRIDSATCSALVRLFKKWVLLVKQARFLVVFFLLDLLCWNSIISRIWNFLTKREAEARGGYLYWIGLGLADFSLLETGRGILVFLLQKWFWLQSSLVIIVVKPGLKVNPVKGPGPGFYGSTRVNPGQPINPGHLMVRLG